MKGIIYLAGLMAFMFTSCTGVGELDGDEAPGADMAPLELSMSVDSVESKSIIEGTSLPFSSEVGVYMTDGTGNGFYQGHDYRNIRYVYALGRLSTDKDVLLSSVPATIHAYYPYVSGGDISKLTINAGTQTDYLYALPASGLDHQNPSAALVMKHVMSVVSFEIVKGDYTGACEVSEVAVKGAGIYASATYDGRTGQIMSRSGADARVASDGGKFTAGSSATIRNIMVIPTESVGEAVLAVIVDGHERTVKIPDLSVVQGKRYLYSLTITDKELILSSLSVSLWDDEGFSHAISLTGDMGNITVGKDVLPDGVIVLKAMPDVCHVNTEVEPVSIIGTADMTQESDIETGIRTITLRNVRSDITVNFNGIYTYDLVTTYKVASSGKTRIMAEGALSYGSSTTLQLMRIRRDDEDMQKQETAELGTGGVVTLKYSFKDHEVPSGMFEGVASLTGVVISDVVKKIGSYSFSKTGLGSVVLPESVETYGDAVFLSCAGLKSVLLPNNMKTIPRQMFSRCSAMLSICIPDSVESFGESSFEGNTGITSIVIPSKVTSIGGRCFYGCKNLRQIVCKPTRGPALTGDAHQTFDTFTLDGICVIPASATSYSTMISNLESCDWIIVRQ